MHTFNDIILWGLHISLSHFMIISLSKISVEVHPQICQLLTHSLCSALELDLLCSKGGHVDPGRQSMLSAHQTCHLEVEPSPCRYIRHPSSPSSFKLLSQNWNPKSPCLLLSCILICHFLSSLFHQHITSNDDDCFYIVLFSALEQTHCARMWFYMSD